jgi:oxygen-independent coproporphyrinogen-3 oxidase
MTQMSGTNAIRSPVFDRELIGRYEGSGPRYTSYPTAVNFHDGFTHDHYVDIARSTNEDLIPSPLSLYFHIPFCSKVCFYCACNKIITNNRRHAEPYLANLHHEIELKGQLFDRDRVVNQLHWGGGTPTFISHEQMRGLMDVTRENFTLRTDDGGDYSIEVDPREVKDDTVPVLRDIGFNRISLGVQDFNPDVQLAVNRVQTQEQTARVIETARREGFHSVNVDLIYGLPKQTVASFLETLQVISQLNPDRIAVYNYAHLPHIFKTQRQINAEELPGADEKLNILQQAIDFLIGKGYQYIGMDHFARPDDELAVAQKNLTLHRNFQGYSTHAGCDSIGMGITAISQIDDCYAQNVRTLEEYNEYLSHDRLPVSRGIKLDNDDRLRRDVIIRLICHFYLAFSSLSEMYNVDFSDYFYNELIALREMEKDELLTMDANGITVLPKGRLLIRNICMVFDKYLKTGEGTSRFSRVI